VNPILKDKTNTVGYRTQSVLPILGVSTYQLLARRTQLVNNESNFRYPFRLQNAAKPTRGHDQDGSNRDATAAFTIYVEYQSTSQDGMPSISEDAWDIVRLGIPIFVARLSFVGANSSDGNSSRSSNSASRKQQKHLATTS
jgi:hypothetical protein